MNRGVIKLSIHEVEILKSMNLLSGHKLLALEQLQTSDSILQNQVQNPQKHNHNQNQNSPNQDHNYNQQQNAQHNNQNLQQKVTNFKNKNYICIGKKIKGITLNLKKVVGNVMKIEKDENNNIKWYIVLDNNGIFQKVNPTTAQIVSDDYYPYLK